MAIALRQVLPMAILLSCLCLGSICGSNASGDGGRGEGLNITGTTREHHSNVCSKTKVPKNAIKLVHRFGPCSPFDDTSPDVEHILRLDSQRVAYLQRQYDRAQRRSSRNTVVAGTSNYSSIDYLQESLPSVQLPLQDGRHIGAPSYVVTVGMGTGHPIQSQTLVFDTSSTVSWIQCQPCAQWFHQVDDMFLPRRSSTHQRVNCADPACHGLPAGTMGCVNNVCTYNIPYAPPDFTSGILSRDSLWLPPLAPSPLLGSFVFGCSHWSRMGTFQGAAGILGLGIGHNSLVNQMPMAYERVFSYCLPSLHTAGGYLILGKRQLGAPASYTTMPPSPHGLNLYHIDLIGISVNEIRLTLAPAIYRNGGTVIDARAIISRIPMTAYEQLRRAFVLRMGRLRKRLSRSVGDLDTCYRFIAGDSFQHPIITLHFEGANLPLTFKQTFLYMDDGNSTYCLGFAPSGTTGTISVLGTLQQQGVDVIYDVGEGKIGFSHPGHCQ